MPRPGTGSGGMLSGLAARIGGVFARATRPDRQPGGSRWSWMPMERQAGVWVTADEAVRVSAVWACLSVISKSIASSRWEVFQEDDAGNREFRRNDPLYGLLNDAPNPEMNAFAWVEKVLWDALLGDHFSEIERNRMGRPVALWPLDRWRCTLVRDPDSLALRLRVTDDHGGEAWLDYADVFHVHGPSLDGLLGRDLVALASRVLGQAIASDEFGGAFFANGTNQGGVLSMSGRVAETEMAAIRQRLSEQHGGPRRAFGVLFLQGGEAKFTPFAPKGDEAQIIETRQHLVEEVCRWFGVPPHKVGHLLRATFNNIEHQGLEFTRDALTPWCERLRQQAQAKLVARPGMRTRIDIDWLAEGDARTKAETDKVLVSGGLMTVNEIRRRRGLNTVGPEGDRLMVQGQMIPLDQVGEQVSSGPDGSPGQRQLPPPDRPPAPPEPGGPDAGDATRALFATAARRAQRRLQARAADAVKAAGGDRDDLAARLEAIAPDQAVYLADQVGEQVGVLRALGLPLAAADLLPLARAFVDDDVARVLDGWDDDRARPAALATDDRAQEIAAALAAAVMERIA